MSHLVVWRNHDVTPRGMEAAAEALSGAEGQIVSVAGIS